jgi:uncharacterized protein (DUF433 family)
MINSRICSTFLLFLIFTFLSCSSIDDPNISETDFITIYANLTIINELNVSKDYHDKLVEELLHEFNIQVADIQKSIEFYQKNPRQWLEILEKVKEKISEFRKTERAIPRS